MTDLIEVKAKGGVKRMIADTPASRARYEAAGFTVSGSKSKTKSESSADTPTDEVEK